MSAEIKTKFVVLNRDQLKDSRLTDPVRNFLDRVYGKYSLGERSFDEQTLPNTSEILILTRGGKIEGAIPFNEDRTMMLAAETDLPDPRKLGYFPGSLLLSEAVRMHPNAWATVSAKNEVGPRAMNGLFSRPEFGFRRVDSLMEVMLLYGTLKGAHHTDQFWAKMTERGMIFAHTLSVHDQRWESYFQFAFSRRKT